jgi:protein TonB
MTSLRDRIAILGCVLACHAAAATLLMRPSPVKKTAPEPVPLMVSLIDPVEVRAPSAPPPVRVAPVFREPAVVPTRPRPAVAPPPREAVAAPTARTSTPAPLESPPTPSMPVLAAPAMAETPVEAPVASAESARSAQSSGAPAAPVVMAAPAPVSVTPPDFTAAYLNNPAPAYPALSRRMGEQGRVLLRVFVNGSGAPEQVELKSSSGYPRLDGVAIDAVKHWKFRPARRGSDAVSAWVLVPIAFNLRS